MSKWTKHTVIVVACPYQGACNDPEALGLDFHQGLTLIYAYCQAATILADQDWRLSKQMFINPGFLSVKLTRAMWG